LIEGVARRPKVWQLHGVAAEGNSLPRMASIVGGLE
jgi:hypothetical protein